jgi:hypothetical protein
MSRFSETIEGLVVSSQSDWEHPLVIVGWISAKVDKLIFQSYDS